MRRVTGPKIDVQRHSLAVRLSHWGMAIGIVLMIGSGWRIYNADAVFGFGFPGILTLGGDPERALALHNDPGMASALAWHLAMAWVVLASYLLFMAWGLLSGHFRRDYLPVGPKSFFSDAAAAVRLRLAHRLGAYNAVQKVLYMAALAGVALMILSGIAIWMPVQTYPLEWLFGGLQGARLVHFAGMVGIVVFLVVHIVLVILMPRTLVAMVLGRATACAPEVEKAESEPAEVEISA